VTEYSFVAKEARDMSQLSQRDRAEVERGAEEARQITLEPPRRDKIERHLNPGSGHRVPSGIFLWLLGDVSWQDSA
jgi:hypothetical protein